MTKGVSNIFTYDQFKDYIKYLIAMANRDHHLEIATGTYIENSITDAYIALLADMFPENNENYFVNYEEFWNCWSEIVECAIVSFVYGVVDYTEYGEVITPCNHELLHLDSVKDEVNKDSEDYIVAINSTEVLWQICTGEIPVRERFS